MKTLNKAQKFYLETLENAVKASKQKLDELTDLVNAGKVERKVYFDAFMDHNFDIKVLQDYKDKLGLGEAVDNIEEDDIIEEESDNMKDLNKMQKFYLNALEISLLESKRKLEKAAAAYRRKEISIEEYGDTLNDYNFDSKALQDYKDKLGL